MQAGWRGRRKHLSWGGGSPDPPVLRTLSARCEASAKSTDFNPALHLAPLNFLDNTTPVKSKPGLQIQCGPETRSGGHGLQVCLKPEYYK